VQAIGVIFKGAFTLAFLLVALWLGVMAWAELERGWWRDVAGDVPTPSELAAEENGWTELARAHAWFADYTGGRPAMDPELLDAYVRDSEEFVQLLELACLKDEIDIDAEDVVVGELAGYAHDALTARAHYYAGQPGGISESLDALHLLFTLIRRLPSDSVQRAALRTEYFGKAVAVLRELAIRPEFPAREARSTFDEHLQAIETDLDLSRAVRAERAMRVHAVVEELEPGALEDNWLRPSWRTLIREGEIVPLCYRRSREELRTLDRLDSAITENERTDATASDPVVARIGVLLDQRPGLRAVARITRLGLAAIEYRQEKESWPMDPSALDDRFEDGSPLDPFSGQLFPFHRSDTELFLAPSQPVRAAEWTLPGTP
jgi:hypothetical protein